MPSDADLSHACSRTNFCLKTCKIHAIQEKKSVHLNRDDKFNLGKF